MTDVLAHRLDEFPAGYSLAGCAPAVPASASPTVPEYALKSSRRSIIFHQPVNSVLIVCLTLGGSPRVKRNLGVLILRSMLFLSSCRFSRIH